MHGDLLSRIPQTYLYETNRCSACGEVRIIVAETPLSRNRIERLCAECCRSGYDSEALPIVSAALPSLLQRPALRVVGEPQSCIYCGSAEAKLMADGPGARCCVDTAACERRILGDVPSEQIEGTLPLTGAIRLGDSAGFSVQAALARYLIFGKSGAGKTNSDIVLAEEFWANGVPTVIFDILGNMWGARSSADGLSPGFPIPIIGGRFGDLPLNLGDAHHLAEVLGGGVSAILDVSLLDREDQHLFAAAFFDALPSYLTIPMHFIVEEVERIAAARSTSKAHFAASTAVSEFARQCRNETIGWTFSTQRVDHVSHDCRNANSVLVAMQNSDEDEQRAIEGQVKSRFGRARARKILTTFAGLKRGEAWLLADSAWLGDDDAEAVPLRFRFRLRKTYDSARQKKIGEVRALPSVRAEVDLTPFTAARRLIVAAHPGEDPTSADDATSVSAGEGGATLCAPEQQRREASTVADDTRRAIMLELLRRFMQWTPRPILAALSGVDATTFTDTLRSLVEDGLVETRRGRGGGVSLTAAGFDHLGVKAPRYSVAGGSE